MSAPSRRAVDVSAGELNALLQGELLGDPTWRLTGLAPLRTAGEQHISFLSNPRYAAQLSSTQAGCVIVGPAQRDAALLRPAAIICADPYWAYARLTQWWAAQVREPLLPGIHASAVVDPQAVVDPSAHIGALAVVEAGARIAAGAVVGPHCFVGAHASLGALSVMHARSVLAQGCHMGARGILHSGAVIGADGFGFAPHQGHWVKIEQLGGVRIGDDVEIGANSCVDRGALDDTVLEDGVKLDNLVQIAHNVVVGAHSAMAGCVGVAGSARIGKHCTLGGGAIVLGHLELVDHVHISAATVISRSILKPGQYSGVFPFDDNAAWEKNAATLRQLHALRDRLRALEKKNP